MSATHFLKNHPFKLTHEFGNLRMYDLNLTIEKLFPLDFDRDQENRIPLTHDQSVQVRHVDQPRIAGSKALKVLNQSPGGDAVLLSKESGAIEISNEGSYVLINSARGYQEKSQFELLHPKGKVSSGVVFLNIYYGVFVAKNSQLVWKRIDIYKNFFVQPDELEGEETDFIWEILFTIYPVPKGNLNYIPGLRSPDPVGHFDGFQSFLLTK